MRGVFNCHFGMSLILQMFLLTYCASTIVVWKVWAFLLQHLYEICNILNLYCSYEQKRLRFIAVYVQALFPCARTTKWHRASALYESWSHAVSCTPFAMLRILVVAEAVFANLVLFLPDFASSNGAYDLRDNIPPAHILIL